MDQDERQSLQDEIVAMALMQLEPPPDSFRPLAAVPDSFERAKQLFVNVFVAQALDQIEHLAGNSKELVAEEAAEYARRGVDLAILTIHRLKASLGLGPSTTDSFLLPN